MEMTDIKLADGEKFCWTVIDPHTGDLVIYMDMAGNTRYRPSLFYSAKHFRDSSYTSDCHYFMSIKTFRKYEISELPVEELQKLFREEAK